MAEPRIILIGSPSWADKAATWLYAQGYILVRHDDRTSYIQRLVKEAAALVLVDSTIPDWPYWIVTLKVEQATRRIPVLVVVHETADCQQAVTVGADFCLPVETLQTNLSQVVGEYARQRHPDLMAELLCQCDEELPARARLGIEKFNAGEYYTQHDLLEAQWMQETGPVRDLYRAILQVGIAYYHITCGNQRGALKMLLRCEQWFDTLPDVCQGVNVRQLQEDARWVKTALETINDMSLFDRALLKPVLVIPSGTSG